MVSILVFQAHTRKTITEHLRRNASQCRRIALCHHLKHLGSREPTTFLLIFRHTKASEEHILQQRLAIIFLVLTLQFLFFLLVQIVTLSVQYFLLQLGIELLMLQSLIRYECFTSTQRKRRLPVTSHKICRLLAVPMNEAKRGSVTYPKRFPR